MVYRENWLENEVEEFYVKSIAEKGKKYGLYSPQMIKVLTHCSHLRFPKGLKDKKSHDERVNYRNYLKRKAIELIKKGKI